MVDKYISWTKKNPPNDGYWGRWPMFYEEMPIEESFVQSTASKCDTAVVVLGRSAGEDRENKIEKGSWYLTQEEERMLGLVRKHFKRACVIINSGSIIDLSGIEKYHLDALLFVWQGGQEMGNGVADVLLGKISPSGKLTDTIAKIEDYPSYDCFGQKEYTQYKEDIYVGYRYFNTFAEDKILYPFGFGLSYTDFEITDYKVNMHNDMIFNISFAVQNIGRYKGKQVVQIYLSAPNGKLGKPSKELAA